MPDIKNFCDKPFKEFTSLADGKVQCCCPSWLDIDLGNLKDGTVEELWNGPGIQKLRASIIDGSYRHCKAHACPMLNNRNFPKAGPVVQKDYDEGKTVLDHGPISINMSHEQHCNLACPSCRVDFIVGSKPLTVSLHKKILGAMQDMKHLTMSGDGDPFSSPLLRKMLQDMTPETYPKLQYIQILTNGLLLTPKMWDSIPVAQKYIYRIQVSVDGASKETYELNRRGGKWDTLLKRLEFISTLSLSGAEPDGPRQLSIMMVVQDNNFREIPAMIELCRRLGFRPVFSKILDCGTYPKGEFKKRAVWMRSHPNFKELCDIIAQHKGKAAFCNLANL